MSAPREILDLIDRFARNAEDYRSDGYNEAQVRREFIDPFFKCLGWDIDNTQGFAEAYKDVIHEDAIKIGGVTKAPDYCFRVGGTRKFFLEAKRPSVNLKTEPEPAFQLRRYAWSAKLPLSILTDFEELAVYDCRGKPAQTDKASAARIRYLTFTDYAEQWDWLAETFSKDAVLRGSFDKYAEKSKLKKGTATVDAAFLKEIEGWRELLARNIALRNPALSQRELNYAVQVTIDRILFLRMCEDRGVEQYGQLAALQNGTATYGRLKELFRKADERYNSGLFHFTKEHDRSEPPDELTTALNIDDRPLKEIFKSLYYPDSPYEFSVLPAEILGQVYEQFLGKVIRLTEGHRAVVEEKPEVRKAGGVYYTPTYIVDYIVKNTVGKLLGTSSPSPLVGESRGEGAAPGLTPRQASKLKILDPACGSGSFLLGAYQFLLDWHRDWYVNDGPEKHTKEIFQGRGGAWLLTSKERKRILVNNIFGVDIDPQAVEVTKLSLLLKVLEGESQQTLERQLLLFHERALPDLASNIKCGNSLIGPDFYDGQQLLDFGEEERYRINVFDWHAEFPQVFPSPLTSPERKRGDAARGEVAGGFDAVIGNPPWGQKEIAEEQGIKKYVWERYPSAKGIYDLFRPFVQKGVELAHPGGLFGMVLPDIVLLKDYIETREYLLRHLAIEAIDWWGMAFADAVIDAATIVGSKSEPTNGHTVRVNVHDPEAPLKHLLKQADFWANPRYVFNLHLTPEKRAIVRKLADCPRLGDFFEAHEGVHSGNIREQLFVAKKLDESCKPLLFGRGEIQPYFLRWEGKYIRLSAIPESRKGERYANAGNPEWYDQDKILVRRTGDYVLAAVDRERRYASNNFFIVFPKNACTLNLDGLCVLLNSDFMTWYFRTIEPRRGRVFAELKIKHLTTFPIVPNGHEATELNRLGIERTLLAKKIALANAPHAVELAKREAELLDVRINMHVAKTFQMQSDDKRPISARETSNGKNEKTVLDR
ncbi:MAG: N-6 DNA methylase [Planctomycetes bacterium]|nr:N-6 DNA methylase [Planctomycetota bacterium]